MRFLVFLILLTPLAVAQEAEDASLPLEADGKLEFSVDEVTWASLDVHPDGSRIVVEVLGDLYTLPIEGGTGERITAGLGFDSQPRFSPDGEQLAFVSDRDGQEALWMLDLESDEYTKLSGSTDAGELTSPAWAPDGSHVVVSKGGWTLGTYEVWAYHVDGGKGVRITKAKAKSDTPVGQRHNAVGAVYSPDGKYLFFARKYGGFGYNVRFPLWQIVRRDLTTGVEDMITQAPGSAFNPVLSPDGETLVYATRYKQKTGLRVRNLSSGEDDWLIYPIQRDDQESRFTRGLLPSMAFVPDGSALVTTRAGKLIRVDLDGTVAEIPMSFDIEQDVLQRLEFSQRAGLGPVKARIISNGRLSPDGEKFAFSAFSRVYVHDFVTGESKIMSPDGVAAGFPSWSPRGNEIVYATWESEGGHIYRQRVRGRATPRQLTEIPAFYHSPVWSKDGERIVALRGNAYERLSRETDYGEVVGSDVVWLQARGGPVNLVVPSRGMTAPHFGPESDRIYLYHVTSGLLSIKYDGTDRQDVLTAKGPGIYRAENEIGAQTVRLSPAGGYAVIQHANQVYVAALVNPNLRKQQISFKNPANPFKRLTDVGADSVSWSPDGREVVWTVGNHVYRRALDTIEFRDDKKEDEGGSGDEESVSEEVADTATVADEDDSKGLLEEDDGVTANVVEVYEPRYVPEGTIALVNGTFITMAGDHVIENGAVVITDGRISSIGAADSVDVPEGAHVVDLGGQFVVPGFIDTHAHFRVARFLPDGTNWSFLANLAYGVTTGMDVQPGTVDLIRAQDLVDAGLAIGPRAYSTGPGVFSNNQFKSAEHANGVLTRYKEHYGVRNIKAYIAGSRKQRHWLVQAARDLKLMPTTEGALDMKLNLTHMIDGFSGNEHNFPLPDLYDDVVQLAARTKIAYTPTLLVTYGGPWAENEFYTTESPYADEKLRRFMPYTFLASRSLRRPWFHPSEYVTSQVAAQAREIVEAGGQVGVGAHGQLQGLGYHWELWALASGGFEPLEALRAATIMGAQMLGFEQDLGSLEEGKLADLVVLTEDPREDIRHTVELQYVMKGGQLFDADTLDEVWPTQRPLPRQWWHDFDPVPAHAPED